MRRIVIGTAGHIDHGKTALVRALTGVDTDRLAIEKQRGITVDLGFARLDLAADLVAGLVDVPGHERFVKAMAAGAGGVDVALLVLASDEGVMPQTREHVDILRLLGVRAGVIALTKSDLLPGLGSDWLPLLHAELDELCTGTLFADAARIPCSARTGEGIPALTAALAAAAGAAEERPKDGPLFLPVDRAFSIRGFGTVVTGTLLSGSVGATDVVDLVPGGPLGVRVRGLQVHGEPATRCFAGQRAALNLAGVEAREIERGMVLGASGALPATPMIDVELELLGSAPRPLAHQSRWLVHVGTAQVGATLVLFDREELAPGETALAQLRLAAPLAILPGQRFILRGFTPVPGRGHTVAGGRVLAILPARYRRSRPEVLEALQLLRDGDAAARIERILVDAGARGLDLPGLAVRTALPEKLLVRSLGLLGARGAAVCYDRERRAWVATATLERLATRAAVVVRSFHEAWPLAAGMPREELRSRLGIGEPRLFARLLALLEERGITAEGEHLGERGRKAGDAGSARALRDGVEALLQKAGLMPPSVPEAARAIGDLPDRVQAVCKLLEREKMAVRVGPDLWFDAAAVGALRERLIEFLLANESISTQQFKELVGTSRKWAMPLGEYFDREKLTLRVADTKRILRGADAWRARLAGGSVDSRA